MVTPSPTTWTCSWWLHPASLSRGPGTFSIPACSFSLWRQSPLFGIEDWDALQQLLGSPVSVMWAFAAPSVLWVSVVRAALNSAHQFQPLAVSVWCQSCPTRLTRLIWWKDRVLFSWRPCCSAEVSALPTWINCSVVRQITSQTSLPCQVSTQPVQSAVFWKNIQALLSKSFHPRVYATKSRCNAMNSCES